MKYVPPFTGPIKRGDKGFAVQFVQEMLKHAGYHLSVDEDFGGQTEATVVGFQSEQHLNPTGVVDATTYQLLITPLTLAFAPIDPLNRRFEEMVIAYAVQHLKQHPQEIPRKNLNENCGPWVREYMDGHEGPDWPWCAGFATYILRQAATSLGLNPGPVSRTYSCEHIHDEAQKAGHLSKLNDAGKVTPGSLFLLHNAEKKVPWAHVGIVTEVVGSSFKTIEGNASDDAQPSHETCVLRRSLPDPHYETYFVHY